MANRLTAISVKATALALALGFSTHVAANMYRYTDENGQIVISSTIPQEATKRGYDILSNNGRVIETIPPAPTEEEIAAREAEKQRQKELAEQREKDRALLKRFSHPDQAVKAMHRKIRELEGLIQLKRGNISVISSQLDSEQSRAANMERAGREIPEATLEKIRRLESQIRDIEREITSQTQEIEELRKAFEADIERLEEVTGEARTVPLDHNETED
jgi:predicted RNase H-like nuclease (RuvC/YqgF family)